MLLGGDFWELDQLASQSGVKPRTIRFYQQSGLLHNPGVRGLKGRYGQADLERLRLIRLLQREGKTLAEIREALSTFDPIEVGLEVERREAELKTAAGYARSVLQSAVSEQLSRYGVGRPNPAPARSTYDRIAITPDIELHVRGPMSQFENTLLLQLLREADRIFHTKTRERL